jgi:superfamily I DNA and/or RNA helicase
MAKFPEHLQPLERLRELVQIEREAERAEHVERLQNLSVAQRVEEGYAWFPVVVDKSGFTIGERAFVIVERTDEPAPHQFRAGKTVNLSTRTPGVDKPNAAGVVQFVNKGRMKIVLNQSYLPDWLNEGKLGVDLLFDERTYDEMDNALEKVLNARGNRLAELRDILLGQQPAEFEPAPPVPAEMGLNESQREAVADILGARHVALVHGPPGTGKTTTLVAAVQLLAQREHGILVTAPSNTAADLLTERIAATGLAVTRIGNISRIDETILSHTLEVQLAQHPDAKEIKKVRIEAAETRRKARRYRRTFDAAARRERGQLFKQAGQLSAWARQLEDRLLDLVLSSAQVIVATLVGSANAVLNGYEFRTVLIDEAAQALEPACWIPIIKASRVILAGDPFQLPPTVKASEAQRGGLEVTLLEKLLARGDRNRLLRTQYRMHRLIMGFSNKEFYDNALIADDSVAEHRLPFDDEPPIVFVDTAGCGFEEKLHPKSLSRYNPEEWQLLREHLYLLIGSIPHGEPVPPIALISPYREQVIQMRDAIAEDERLADLPITVDTIDGFQGQERDVVYISLVRSNAKGEIGFLRDLRRMNVALTRARKKLVVVGDSATVGQHAFYADLIDYVSENGRYESAWSYLHS